MLDEFPKGNLELRFRDSSVRGLWGLEGLQRVCSAFVAYSKPQKVGNRIRDKQCWDSPTLLLRIEDIGFPTIWTSTIYGSRRVLEGSRTSSKVPKHRAISGLAVFNCLYDPKNPVRARSRQ